MAIVSPTTTLIAAREAIQMSNELTALAWGIAIAPPGSTLYSDSVSAIQRLKRPGYSEHPIFSLIPRLLKSNDTQLRFVPTKRNKADHASRRQGSYLHVPEHRILQSVYNRFFHTPNSFS